jgi:hypothetical protein
LNAAVLSVAAAALVAAASVTIGARARAALHGLAPPSLAALLERTREAVGDAEAASPWVLAEVASERRGALSAMVLLLLRVRSVARISLASGTATALLALADGLGRGPLQALPAALLCFTLGGGSALILAWLGRSARDDWQRFRDQWNQREREVGALARKTGSGEWTHPGAAG